MLRLLQTKILITILAVLGILASAAIYQCHEAHKKAVLRERFRRQVEQNKKQYNSAAGKEGNTWRSYIP
jgi:phage-related minor tail protein